MRRKFNYGYIVDKDKNVIDEVLLSYMKAPNTYTREDIIEINCHGGIISAKKILSKNGLIKNLRIFYDRGYYLNKTINNFLHDNKFIAYVSVFNDTERFTVVHPACLDFHFIEEGVEAYHTSHSLSHFSTAHNSIFSYEMGIKGFFQRVKSSIRRFGYTEAITSIPIFSIAFRHDNSKLFYCFSEESYPFAENKRILSFTSIKKRFFPDTDFSKFKDIQDQCLWIGNVSMFQNSQMFKDFLNNYLLKFLEKEHFKKLYIRFHYRESIEQKDVMIDFLKRNRIEYETISDSIIMELFLLSVPRCNCIGFNSSLLLYAAHMGHRSISFSNQRNNNIDIRFPAYKKYVNYLDTEYFNK